MCVVSLVDSTEVSNLQVCNCKTLKTLAMTLHLAYMDDVIGLHCTVRTYELLAILEFGWIFVFIIEQILCHTSLSLFIVLMNE